MVNVEIIVIGNELLLGLVQDTNSNYLCRVLRGMGGRVRHAAVVRDEADAIADEVRASLARHTDLLFTCGGLGPTDDDLTLAAIARALDRPLEINAAARAFVERRYTELAAQGYVASAALTEARLKMARLPAGAHIIDNPVGAAPAVVIATDAARVVALPGVFAGPYACDPVRDPSQTGSWTDSFENIQCYDSLKVQAILNEINRQGSQRQISQAGSEALRDEFPSGQCRPKADLKRTSAPAGISTISARRAQNCLVRSSSPTPRSGRWSMLSRASVCTIPR